MNEKTDICQGFISEAHSRGIPKEAAEGMLTELGWMETSKLSKEARERDFLSLWNHKYATVSELQEALIKESENFRAGLKQAMLSEGVEEAVIDGIFKEAEDRFSEIMSGGLSKEAGIGSFLRGAARVVKAPQLEANALRRGFASSDDFLKSLAPGISQADTGLEALGKLPELNAGATRIYVGDKIKDLGLHGTGDWIANSGKNALRNQATHLADKAYAQQSNDLLRKVQTEAESASGVAAKTRQELGKMKTMKIPNTHQAGSVPQATIQSAADSAAHAVKDPFGASKIHSVGGGGGWGRGHFRLTPGRGLGRAAGGALLGGLTLGPLGALGGAAVGGLTGTLGTGGTLLAGAGLYTANKMFNPGPKPGSYEPGADRNRVLPFMSNQWTGGLGGALAGSILANELGLEGAGAWLLPLLGGVAGYNYLPDLVNNYKDPLGYGNNAIPMSHQAGNLGTFGYTPQQ